MDKIKFRGWSRLQIMWLYGSLINNAFFTRLDGRANFQIVDTDLIQYDCFQDIGDQLHTLEVVAESVGQYTSFKDKQSKEVYTGDVLYQSGHVTFFVGLVNGSYVLKPTNSVQRSNWAYKPLGSLDWSEWVVIGNQYENPELIQDG